MIEIKYLNKDHQDEIEKYISCLKEIMYFATDYDGCVKGKYREYEKLLNTVVLYSNNFYNTMNVEKLKSTDEFIFLMPNMFFYLSIGFLGGIRDRDNDITISESEVELSTITEDLVGVLADILIDTESDNKIISEAVQEIISKN